MIELLVVLACIGLLLAVAAPRHLQQLEFAREVALQETLRATRQAIDHFHADHGRYPDALQELVERRYLHHAPVDPVLDSATRWTLVPPGPDTPGRVSDLRSSAPGVGRDGVPYVQW